MPRNTKTCSRKTNRLIFKDEETFRQPVEKTKSLTQENKSGWQRALTINSIPENNGTIPTEKE